MKQSLKLKLLLLLGLLCATVSVGIILFSHRETNILRVAFLDIGQGDAIYIQAPNGATMLVDSGRDDRVLNKLAAVMPYGAKNIDVILATHPDADHVGGFVPVFQNYHVQSAIYSGRASDTQTYQELTTYMNSVPHVIARQGMVVTLDTVHHVYFQVLYPDRDVSHVKQTNDASIVGQLIYGNERFMLTGDAPMDVEARILAENPPDDLKTTVLKLGHHGSKYSTSNPWLDILAPLYAIVSAGVHNSYGHPNKETVDRVNAHHIPILSTMTDGTIIFETDGVTLTHE